MRRVEDIQLDAQIVVQEVDREVRVGEDASDLGRAHDDVIGAMLEEECARCGTVFEVEFSMGARQDLVVRAALQCLQRGRAHQAAMACDEYLFYLHLDP